MIARVASFEGVNVDAAERTMDEAASVIRPLVESLAGYQGLLELVAPDGKVLSVTFFDSEENAQAAEPTFDQEMPLEARRSVQGLGRPPSVGGSLQGALRLAKLSAVRVPSKTAASLGSNSDDNSWRRQEDEGPGEARPSVVNRLVGRQRLFGFLPLLTTSLTFAPFLRFAPGLGFCEITCPFCTAFE
jgi:hypothetical protein